MFHILISVLYGFILFEAIRTMLRYYKAKMFWKEAKIKWKWGLELPKKGKRIFINLKLTTVVLSLSIFIWKHFALAIIYVCIFITPLFTYCAEKSSYILNLTTSFQWFVFSFGHILGAEDLFTIWRRKQRIWMGKLESFLVFLDKDSPTWPFLNVSFCNITYTYIYSNKYTNTF